MVPAAALAKIGIGSIIAGVASTGAIIGSIVVNLAISALLGKLLAPDVPKTSKNVKGIQNIIRSNIAPRRIIYGEAMTGGPYALIETSGDGNEYLNMIVVVAGHPIEDFLGVTIEDEYVDISGNTNGTSNDDANDLSTSYFVNQGKFGTGIAANHVKIIKNLGWGYADYQHVTDDTATHVVNDRERAALIANETFTPWIQPSTTTRDSTTGLYTDSGYKLTNCAHIFLSFKFNRDVWSGFPRIKFHVKGKRIYNPQLDSSRVSEGADSAGTHDLTNPDTWEWSEDWTLAILDYLLNKSYGLAARVTGTLTEIHWADAIQSYLDSSAVISTGADSPWSADAPRYTINGILETNSTPISNMEALLTSGAGELVYAQGEYKIRPGIYRWPDSPDDIINEDMMVSGLSIRTHTPRSDLFNKAAGVYTDKGYDPSVAISTTNKPKFEPTDFGIVDPLDSSGTNPYEVADEEEIIREFDFPFTTWEYEAQRLARIQLERARQGMTVSFEGNLKVLRYAVGDTVYLEILSNSAFIGEAFYNRLGLDGAVQNRPDSPGTAYYKQFKIVNMEYTDNATILVSLVEESEEIYDWNAGYANTTEHSLESGIVADDPTGTVLAPSWVVNSPFVALEENAATESGTTVTTLIRWSGADRGSTQSAIDRSQISYYNVEYGIITDPSLTAPANVQSWIAAGTKAGDHDNIIQGPLALETLYKDGVEYDFRVQAVTYSGRASAWAYYSIDTASTYNPSAPPASSNDFYYIRPLNGTSIQNGVGTLSLEARQIIGGVDSAITSGTIQLYEGATLVSTGNGYPSPSDGYTGTLGATEISGDAIIVLKDGAGGTPYDSITLLDVSDGDTGPQGPAGADGEVGWGHDLVFSATDADTVAWTAGTIWTAAGDTFSVDAGNTGNMTARTYIYFEEDGVTPINTTMSLTTSAQTAVGVDKILVAVAEDTTTEAFFQVFGGYGGLKIAADEIAANSIVANNIAASFYEGRTFTGGVFQTREPLSGSPYSTEPRAVLQGGDPQLAIYVNQSNVDIPIFSVTDVAGSAEVSIVGDFEAGSLDTAQMFSSAGITDLRGRLGVTVPANPTGGIATRSLPTTLSTPNSADYELDVDIYDTGLNENTLTFTIRDNGTRFGSSNNPYTAPTWSLQFFYSTGSPHTWTAVPGGNFTVTGTTNNWIEDTQPITYWNSFTLNATRQVQWTPGSPFASTDPIYYMIRVDITGGDSDNPKLTALSASEAVVGDAGGGNVSNTGTPLDNQVAVWVDETTIEGDPNFTWNGVTSALSIGTNLVIDDEGGTPGSTGATSFKNGLGTEIFRFSDADGQVMVFGASGEEFGVELRDGTILAFWGAAQRYRIRADTTSSFLTFDQEGTGYGAEFAYPIWIRGSAASSGPPITNFVTDGAGIFASQYNANGSTALLAINEDGNAWPVTNQRSVAFGFSTFTAAVDPGPGICRLNNVSFASVTAGYFPDESWGFTDTGWFWTLANVGDILFFHQGSDTSRYLYAEITSITNNTGWYTIGLTPLDHAGTTFLNADDLQIELFPSGILPGTVGGSIADNQIAVGSATANNIEGDASFTWDSSTASLTLYDTTDTDSVSFQHDGTDFQITPTTTSTIIFNDGASVVMDTATGVNPFYISRIDANLDQSLEVYVDDTNAIFNYRQDETVNAHYLDFNYTHSGVGNPTGAHQFRIQYEGSERHRFYMNNDRGGYYMFGGLFRIYDDTGNDYASFAHDGVDFNTTLVGTTDWNVTGGMFRLIDTGDAGLNTENHPFQVGLTTGSNVIIDNNEIGIRNGGDVSDLWINEWGGTVRIGGSAATDLLVTGYISSDSFGQFEAASGGTGLYLYSTANWTSGTLYAPALRWREADGTSIASIRGYVGTGSSNHLALGTGFINNELIIDTDGLIIGGTAARIKGPRMDDFSILHQSLVASTSSTPINYESGQSVDIDLNANTTISVTNWPASGTLGQIEIEILQDTTARTIIWPTGTTWVNGSAPDLTTTDTRYFVHLRTRDGGTNIYGSYPYDAGGGDLADGTSTDSTVRWSGGAWIEETSFKVNASGEIFIGGDTTGKLEAVTGNYGSVQCDGAEGSSGTYEGFSIAGRLVFMESGSGTGGIYDDVNNAWKIRTDIGSTGSTQLYYGTLSLAQLVTQSNVAADSITGVTIRHTNDTLYDAGLAVMQRGTNVNDNLDVTLTTGTYTITEDDWHRTIRSNANSGSHTINFPTLTDVPDGAVLWIMKIGSGTTSISASGTLRWMDGSGTSKTGTRTLAQYGWVTAWKFSDTQIYITGSGLS